MAEHWVSRRARYKREVAEAVAADPRVDPPDAETSEAYQHGLVASRKGLTVESHGRGANLRGKSTMEAAAISRMARDVERQVEGETACAPARELARDGVWLVQPSARPRGWERMGLREREPGTLGTSSAPGC
jgi:hypothetical protein